MLRASQVLNTRGGACDKVDVLTRTLTNAKSWKNKCMQCEEAQRMQVKACMEAGSQCKGRIQPVLSCLIIEHWVTCCERKNVLCSTLSFQLLSRLLTTRHVGKMSLVWKMRWKIICRYSQTQVSAQLEEGHATHPHMLDAIVVLHSINVAQTQLWDWKQTISCRRNLSH